MADISTDYTKHFEHLPNMKLDPPLSKATYSYASIHFTYGWSQESNPLPWYYAMLYQLSYKGPQISCRIKKYVQFGNLVVHQQFLFCSVHH